MPFQSGQPDPVVVPFALAKSAAEDDLIATDATTGAGYKASEQTWNTDLATTRAAFVTRFAGASNQAKDANKPVLYMAGFPGGLLIYTGGVRDYAVKAGTYKVGDLVGPAKQTGNLLEDQLLEVVSADAQAIGVVKLIVGSAVNPTRVHVDLLSTVFKAAK